MGHANEEWLLGQVFLSPTRLAVYEVEIEREGRGIRCSCPPALKGRRCHHVTLVRAHMESNNGQYALKLNADVSDEMDLAAAEAPPVPRPGPPRRPRRGAVMAVDTHVPPAGPTAHKVSRRSLKQPSPGRR